MTSVLGVDLSTQTCTVEVRDAATFTVIGRSRAPLPPTTPPVSEQDAPEWWGALVTACAGLAATGVALDDVGSVSVAGQCHGLVPLGRGGEPIRAVKLWNDTTSAPQIRRLVEKIGAGRWVRRTGSVPTAAFTVAKLAWLLEEEPATASAIRTILLPHDYLTFRLTGEYVTDRSEASGTGYFNSVTNTYDIELLRECFGDVLPWRHLFPAVGAPSQRAGTVTVQAARELGLRPGIPVAVGGGDQHMAALGLGIGEGDVVFSLGTSGVVLTPSSRPVADESGRVDGVADARGGWLPLVCTLNCTKTTDWAAGLLGVDVHGLDQLALAVPVDAAVPVFATYLDGERSPSLPTATGVVSGLTRLVGREEFAAAVFRGVVMGLMCGLDAIHQCDVDTSGRVLAVGGGARSDAYVQTIADLQGTDVQVMDEPEATVRGACIQALAVLEGRGVAEVADSFRPGVTHVVGPRPGARGWPSLRDDYLSTSRYAATTHREQPNPRGDD